MTRPLESVNIASEASLPTMSQGVGPDSSRKVRFQQWCRWQFNILPDARALVLFSIETSGSFADLGSSVAAWPEETHSESLRPIAVQALQQQKCLSGRVRDRKGEGEGICLAIPMPANAPQFVALVLSGDMPPSTQQANRQLVEWGSFWLLENHPTQTVRESIDAAQALAQTVALHESVQASCEELVARLADTLNCECVGIGFTLSEDVVCKAISGAPKFDGKMAFINAIESAMGESIEQNTPVCSSPDPNTLSRCHEHLRSVTGGLECFTVPITFKEKKLGAITVMGMRDGASPADFAWLERVTVAVAPVLNLQLREERTLLQRLGLRLLDSWQTFSGREHTGRQLLAMGAVLFFLCSILLPGTHRVSAKASLEGSDKQVITAPTNGFVLEANARAGDTVLQGDIIARLDDRELLVKQRQWRAELDKLDKSYSQALAESNRTELSLLRAQRAEFNAELELVEQQLSRNVIKAPFSGVLVAGDLSQQLGAPVETGETLFEITSLDSWRLLIDVDERAIAEIETGQNGALRLASMPDHGYSLTVHEIMPVALSRDGETVFRLEATINEQDDRLRPGMQGVAKIDVGQRPYLWLWTHRLVQHIRIWFWSIGL